jgi:tRNA (guanosine-2'-O-)-methyltransferase
MSDVGWSGLQFMSDRKTATAAEMRDLVAATRTDDESWFTFGDRQVTANELRDLLSPHVSEARKHTMERVLDDRTESVAVVIEGMVDLGNVSAVMRTADGFGIQRIHSIDTAEKYKRSKRTTQGADKWVDRYRWESTEDCYSHLAADGYRIVAADIGEDAQPLSRVDLTDRCALVFGNELEGLSALAKERADARVTIPMGGFTESFNISVAAAIVLYETSRQRTEQLGAMGDLSPAARDRIRAVWYAKSVPNMRSVVEHKLSVA